MDVREIKELLREAFRDSFPYLAEPRRIESLIKDLTLKYCNIHDILKELERLAAGGNVSDTLLVTDLRILANSLRRLLASHHGKRLINHG